MGVVNDEIDARVMGVPAKNKLTSHAAIVSRRFQCEKCELCFNYYKISLITTTYDFP